MTSGKVACGQILRVPPNRVWRTYPGGRKLDLLEGQDSPADTHFPEDWIVSTTRAVNKGREHLTEEGLSKVVLNGETVLLKNLCERFPNEILGPAHFKKFGANAQFLLKFLDSAIRLHIQCHPTISFAQKHLNSNSGKTEVYVILGIRDEVKDPYIYLGFQHLPQKEEFKQAIENQDSEKILSCFEKIHIKPGDVFFVPGGMPHAIGEGVFMIEIMEPTDFAVRIEFERGGYVLPEASRFMSRGIDFALSMFNFETTSVEDVRKTYFCQPRVIQKQKNSTEYSIVDECSTSCFSVKRISVNGLFVKEEDSFYVGIISKGSGRIIAGDEIYPVKIGDNFFVPYQTDSITFESEAGMEVIVTLPPR